MNSESMDFERFTRWALDNRAMWKSQDSSSDSRVDSDAEVDEDDEGEEEGDGNSEDESN